MPGHGGGISFGNFSGGVNQETQPRRSTTRRNELGEIIEQDFRPEFERLQGEQAGLEERFFNLESSPIDFEAFRGELSALAESVTSDLFGAGGGVERSLQGARGRTVETGFGTSSGGLQNATQNIFAGARDQVANVIGTQAAVLSGQAVQHRANRLSNLRGFTEFQSTRLDTLREGLFGGQATIEQLRLAQEQQRQNKRLIDEAIEGGGGSKFGSAISGAASGALAGSLFGGPGAAIGGAIGFVGGLF